MFKKQAESAASTLGDWRGTRARLQSRRRTIADAHNVLLSIAEGRKEEGGGALKQTPCKIFQITWLITRFMREKSLEQGIYFAVKSLCSWYVFYILYK